LITGKEASKRKKGSAAERRGRRKRFKLRWGKKFPAKGIIGKTQGKKPRRGKNPWGSVQGRSARASTKEGNNRKAGIRRGIIMELKIVVIS